MGALKWHGGKTYLASKIVELMPQHTRFLDAYCGGLNVLLAKPCEGISEFANDLNGDLMNFWWVLKNTPDRLLRALWGTPLSQHEYTNAVEVLRTEKEQDCIRRATAFFVQNRMSRQGLGADYCTPTKRTRRGMNENVSAWWSAIEGLPEIHERLRRVEIWNRDAIEAIQTLDSEDFLVYADPPYVHSTRSSVGEYGKFEMDEAAHNELLRTMRDMRGNMILSGYANPLYDDFAWLHGFNRVEIKIPNHASSASVKEIKTECLWMNF